MGHVGTRRALESRVNLAITTLKLLAMMLVAEMERQYEHLKEDMADLIKKSLLPIKASSANFHEMVDSLGRRVAALETKQAKTLMPCVRRCYAG